MGPPGHPGSAADASAARAHPRGSGAAQLVNYFVGQIVGEMNQVKPARQVVFDIVDEFIDAVQGLEAKLAE